MLTFFAHDGAEPNAEIDVGGTTVEVEWSGENDCVRGALLKAAPFEAEVSLWGDELYFEAPVDMTPEETETAVEVGTVAYWHRGNAVCVFWGPTPASTDEQPRAAGPVAPVGRIEDVEILSSVEAGEVARFETS